MTTYRQREGHWSHQPDPIEHDADDFINPIGLGRALLGYIAIVLLVAACAATGIYLGGRP